MKVRTYLSGTALLLLSLAISSSACAQTSDADFQKAVEAYQHAPGVATDEAATVITLSTTMQQLPPIPEEAREHFARGAELARDAKSPDYMKTECIEFGRAVLLAPWWPEARYNLALTLEAMGEYPSAIANLKLYRLFKLSDANAREAQTRIYALERKQEEEEGWKEKVSNQAGNPAPAPSSLVAAPSGKMQFSYAMTTKPWVRFMIGTVKDVRGLWNALAPLQRPPGAYGDYGLIGDDQLLGGPPGYGLRQLGVIARKYIKFDRIYVEQPSGWEPIGIQSGVFTEASQMNDATLGWAFFDLRSRFESDMKKLANSRP
jgi:hypothetical protein